MYTNIFRFLYSTRKIVLIRCCLYHVHQQHGHYECFRLIFQPFCRCFEVTYIIQLFAPCERYNWNRYQHLCIISLYSCHFFVCAQTQQLFRFGTFCRRTKIKTISQLDSGELDFQYVSNARDKCCTPYTMKETDEWTLSTRQLIVGYRLYCAWLSTRLFHYVQFHVQHSADQFAISRSNNNTTAEQRHRECI